MPTYRKFPPHIEPPKKELEITLSNSDGKTVTWHVAFDKFQFLKKVEEWWDAHGTNYNDYEEILIKTKRKGTGNG